MKNSKVLERDWWTEPVALAKATPKKEHTKRRRVTLIYLIAAALLLPLALLANAAMVIRLAQGSEGNQSASLQTNGSQEAAQAQVLIQNWLSQDPAPLLDGRVVSFIGSATSSTTAEDTSDGQVPTTTYSFAVSDSHARLYQASIQLARNGQGVSALSTPALMPIPNAAQISDQNIWPWPGVDSVGAGDDFDSAVQAWATAFTSGNASTLKQTVGDPSEGHAYIPLSGVSFKDVSVSQVGALWGKDQEPSDTARPVRAIARVSVSADWGNKATDGSNDLSKITYDVLLDRANTAAPVVVAWGPPGSSNLQPYSNAVSQTDSQSDTGNNTSTPSPTASSSATASSPASPASSAPASSAPAKTSPPAKKGDK